MTEVQVTCSDCDQNYKYRLTKTFENSEMDNANSTSSSVASMSIGDFLEHVKERMLKFTSHGDAQELECGNCYTLIDISDLGREEGDCNTHDCQMKYHYSKLVIVGCAPDCETCKGCKDW